MDKSPLFKTCAHCKIDHSKLICEKEKAEFWNDEMCHLTVEGKTSPCEAYELKTEEVNDPND